MFLKWQNILFCSEERMGSCPICLWKKKMVAGAQSRAEVKESMCVCVKGFGAQLTELSLLGCSLVRVSISGQ